MALAARASNAAVPTAIWTQYSMTGHPQGYCLGSSLPNHTAEGKGARKPSCASSFSRFRCVGRDEDTRRPIHISRYARERSGRAATWVRVLPHTHRHRSALPGQGTRRQNIIRHAIRAQQL
jgi:hypothetical protein